MAFMEPQIEFGKWYEIDGPAGTEFIPADLVGSVTIEKPDGAKRVTTPTLDDLQEYDRVMGRAAEDEGDSVRFPIPSLLKDFCENREAWRIDLVEGYGARLSASGYMDCTEWSVFETEKEARDYLEEMYGNEDEGGD
jgi:hypothetical protein